MKLVSQIKTNTSDKDSQGTNGNTRTSTTTTTTGNQLNLNSSNDKDSQGTNGNTRTSTTTTTTGNQLNLNSSNGKDSQGTNGNTRTSTNPGIKLQPSLIQKIAFGPILSMNQYFYGDAYLIGKNETDNGHTNAPYVWRGMRLLNIYATKEPIYVSGYMKTTKGLTPQAPTLVQQKCNNFYGTDNVYIYGDMYVFNSPKKSSTDEVWATVLGTFQESSSPIFQKRTFYGFMTVCAPDNKWSTMDGRQYVYMHETINRYTYGKFHYMANRNKKSNEPHSIIHSVPNSTTANGPAQLQDGSTNGVYQSSNEALDPEMTRGVTDIYHRTINIHIYGDVYVYEGTEGADRELTIPPSDIKKIFLLNKGCGIYKTTSCDNQKDPNYKLKDNNSCFNKTGSQLDTKEKKTDGNSNGEIGSDTVPTHIQQNQEANDTKTIISSDLSLELHLKVVTVNTNRESIIVNINLGKKANNSGT